MKTISITPYEHKRHANVGTINSYHHDLRWQTEAETSLNISQRTPQAVLVVKALPATAEDTREAGSIPAWGRPTGGGKWHLLQDSCLQNHMDERSLVGCSPRGRRVRHD